MKKRILCIAVVLCLCMSMLPLTAMADAANNISVTDATYYTVGETKTALKSITAKFGWTSGGATCRLVLMEEYLKSGTGSGSGSGYYGDFTNEGNYGSKFLSFDEVLKFDNDSNDPTNTTKPFGIIDYSDEEIKVSQGEKYSLTFEFDENDILLSKEKEYYVYLWTYYNSHYYPDNLICVISVDDGEVKYVPASGSGENWDRNSYNKGDFSEVKNSYNVTFNANGHGTAPDVQNVIEGDTVSEPAAITALGYNFGGWYKDISCTDGNEWDFAKDTVTENITLYAKWVEDTPAPSPSPSPEPEIDPDAGIILGGIVYKVLESDAKTLKLPEKETYVISSARSFSDVALSDWFYDSVMPLAKKGIISGYPDGTFMPYGEVTWGEALKLVMKTVGYGDIPATSDHWASGYKDLALQNGLIPADVDLDAPITRGEMADLTAAAVKPGEAKGDSPFADAAPASAVALYEAGIIKGSADNGQLLYRAESTITRAEMSAILWRVFCAR